MKSPTPNRRRRHGFLLMEIVLALGIFGIAVTGFTIAIARTAEVAAMAQRQAQINRLLESALTAALSIPALEEGRTSFTPEETIGGSTVEIDTLVELMPEIGAENGRFLQEMYRIEVSAHWFEDGEWRSEIAETWRYGRLYQP